jgi:hypothetical protein
MDGHFDSGSPGVGTRVLPGSGNQLNIGYSGPIPVNGLPSTVPIQDGEIIHDERYYYSLRLRGGVSF